MHIRQHIENNTKINDDLVKCVDKRYMFERIAAIVVNNYRFI